MARALDLPYIEGDTLHPSSNIEKMSSGQPLTDSDREPWLLRIRTTAERMAIEVLYTKANVNTKRGVVISCSALKKRYRDVLRGIEGEQETYYKINPWSNEEYQPIDSPFSNMRTLFVYIEGTRDVLMERMTKRILHFMKPSMLDKQLEDLEEPVQNSEDGIIIVSMMDSTENQVRAAQQGLKRVLNIGVQEQALPVPSGGSPVIGSDNH